MVVSVHPARSAAYYIDQVASERHDYYAGHGEAPGVWTGKFAADLGLSGEVTPEAFRAVLAETHPETGERLKRWRNTKVTAWDLHFAPPKSVSALWAIAPPEIREVIAQAQAAAVQAALGYLAEHACVARLGKQGVNAQPGTGFATATFTHRTSREGDPQLHTHAVTGNIAETIDGRRAALDGARFYAHRFAADGVYLTALHAGLSPLGLAWTLRDGQWEIEGMPAGLCRIWSTRSAQIREQMAARGTSGGRAAEAAALATRRPKPDVAPDGENLHDRFQQQARDAGYLPEQIVAATLHRTPVAAIPDELEHPRGRERGPAGRPGRPGRLLADPTVADTAAAMIAELVGPEGLTEKASSFGRRDVIDHAAQLLPRFHPLPAATADEARQLLERIADRVTRDPRVIPLLEPAGRSAGEVIRPRDEHGRVLREVCTQAERRYSTVDLLAAEHELLQRAHARQTDRVAVVSEEQVEAALAAHAGLDADQEAMVRRLASSGAGVDVVVGKAGTGKTSALRCYGEVARRAGVPVVGVAPSATAAHQLSVSAGIEACTLDKLLVEVAHGHRHLPAGVVVIVDEAAMVDTRNRLALQRLVDNA
ncbi:MAG: relaxase domain-containing protein, partial [Micromonosporaceae bacterium]|nr:relaxase domain-containing protein [Micromonosporaceae bacterium]